MSYNPIETGRRIKEGRNTLGLSQEAFAEQLDIGRVHLAKIEVGIRTPSIEILTQISLLTGFSLDYLILGKR